MKFSIWKRWVGELPWKFKWFVLLLLVRPIIDLTYDKKLFFSYSMLEVIGVLTPVIIVFLFVTGKLKSFVQSRSNLDKFFGFWILLLIFNAMLIIASNPSMPRLKIALKVLIPAYLYFFLRHFVKSRKDLEGILQTFLYSSFIPIFLVLYETFFGAFRVVESRGVARIMGGYADVVSMGIYILYAFLIGGYFLMEKIQRRQIKQRDFIKLGFIFFILILALTQINHLTSYGTFAALAVLFVFYNFRLGKYGIVLAIFFVVATGFFITQFNAQENVTPMLQRDISVVRGEVNSNFALHGRIGRWRRMLAYFNNAVSFPMRFLGTGGMVRPILVIATHNDFLRIYFLTGYLGLFAYFMILFTVFSRSKLRENKERYLIKGMLVIVCLLSISTVPTLYITVNYVYMTVIAYMALPHAA